MNRPSSLHEVLAYENADVVERFEAEYPEAAARSRTLFDDLKRWLWLNADLNWRRSHGEAVPELAILSCQRELDAMWHTFVLFTRDYLAFCEAHCGGFLHHVPTTEREKREREAAAREAPELERTQRRAFLREQFGWVIGTLGPDVARRWYGGAA